MKASKIKIFILFSFFSVYLFAQSDSVLVEELRRLFPTEASELVKTKKLTYMNYDGREEGRRIIFRSALCKRIEQALPLKDPVFTMDVVYLVKKESINNRKDVLKILQSISTLKGIQYYSSSRKKMRLLYKDSYTVKREKMSDGTFKYTKTQDITSENIDGLSIYACQEDLTFGKNIYQYSYFKEGAEVGVLVSNVEPLYYSIFKALNAQDVNSYLIINDMQDYFLVYASTRARFKKIIGLETKIKNSFMNRLDAMSKWFIKKYNE